MPGAAGGRIRTDTYLGMALSNIVAFFIILDTGAVLHAHGITDIQTGAQAAEALRPLAGELAFLLFSIGIIGTGLDRYSGARGFLSLCPERGSQVADRTRAQAATGRRDSTESWPWRP